MFLAPTAGTAAKQRRHRSVSLL